MTRFAGEFNVKIDAKGRIRLPGKLLQQLEPFRTDGFMMNRGSERCVVMYLMQDWDRIVAGFERLNRFVKQNREFVRYFHRGCTEIELDSADRLLLPKHLVGYAQMDKEVVILAYLDRIEFWSQEVYNEEMADEPQDFSEWASEVMGNSTPDM